MLAKKPYDKSPYEVFKELKAPWLDELRQNVTKVIDAYYALIHDEAQLDGVPRLADEDFLYERFVDNVRYNLYYSNWEVLKYFNIIMHIKMYKEFIGEWTFTDHDVEMYNYFNSINVNNENKCAYQRLTFSSTLDAKKLKLLDEDLAGTGYVTQNMPNIVGSSFYTYYAKNRLGEQRGYNVNRLLNRKKLMLYDMIRNCRMCNKATLHNTNDDQCIYNYFESDFQWSIAYGGELYDYTHILEFNQLYDVSIIPPKPWISIIG